jgi:hypothetical protein
MPAIDEVIVDGEDRLWVRAYDFRTSRSIDRKWHIFNSSGEYVGGMAVPAALEIQEVHGNRVLAVTQDSEGVPLVVVLQPRR